MASPKLRSLVLIAICCLALASKSNAECCRETEEVIFKIAKGDCNDVKGIGYYRDECQIYVCANGSPVVGTYCGKGSCNIFGCNCDGGCLTGNWSQSFVQNNRFYGIEVVRASRVPY
ncbi:protein Diedel-like [Drosophila ficusphila]|uniref:protein Diedel-like n=1 Tax=Drosophila ficusphila TaxID=30025 RepID=UPI0007E5D817|nr:protein Diedel-like [Drosophila ficusphila]